jgi:hypothetical protein
MSQYSKNDLVSAELDVGHPPCLGVRPFQKMKNKVKIILVSKSLTPSPILKKASC